MEKNGSRLLDIEIDDRLRRYMEINILPLYDKNEEGHGIEHINYVIDRCFKFARYFENINLDMLYTVAVFHDIGHHIDKEKHEVLSAEIFYNNEDMKEFFNDTERLIIKEAIEDHRASSIRIPRSDYGKIISSADRNTSVIDMMRRMYSYTLRHHPNISLEEIINRCFIHATLKYGVGGYAKMYVEDIDYNKFLEEFKLLTSNKEMFKYRFLCANNILTKEYTTYKYRGKIKKKI